MAIYHHPPIDRRAAATGIKPWVLVNLVQSHDGETLSAIGNYWHAAWWTCNAMSFKITAAADTQEWLSRYEKSRSGKTQCGVLKRTYSFSDVLS